VRRRDPDPTDWLPTPAQDALLRVALAPPGEVAAAWARYRDRLPLDRLDTLDWGGRRLVPLVAWRLREAGLDDNPATDALRADLAASMLAVRAKLPAFAAVLDTFEAAGIEVLVLKGVGLAPLAYPDPGTRPVSDLDVLVPSGRVGALDELIARHGGYTSYDTVDPAVRARWRHGAEARIDGHLVDVHWRLLVDRFDGRPDDALFDRAVDITVGGRPARTLGVEDHLVHAIGHGVRRNSLAPVRWIADVARLVGARPVDWSAVEARAAERGLGGVVGRALALVHRDYGVPVHEATLRALRRSSGPTRGRPDLWSRSPKRTRVGGAVNVSVVHYVLATHGWPRRERLARWPEYLRYRMLLTDRDTPEPAGATPRWHG
jgi:hypothetical protein